MAIHLIFFYQPWKQIKGKLSWLCDIVYFLEMWKQTKFLKFQSGILYNPPTPTPFFETPIQTLSFPQISYVSRWTSAETAAPQGSAEVRWNLQAKWLPMAT